MIKGHRSYNVHGKTWHVFIISIIIPYTDQYSTHTFTCGQHSKITGLIVSFLLLGSKPQIFLALFKVIPSK